MSRARDPTEDLYNYFPQKKEQPLDRWESVPDFLLYLHYQVKVMERHKRVIFHIDVNSAFLSWTAVQLMQSGHEDIRLIPSVVSGDPHDRRSIITAASIPAKKLDIKTAEPVSMALRKCPDLIVVQGDWEWYRKCSEGFIEICRRYSPVLQQFSIDECFIDMTLRNWGEEVQEKMWPLEVRELLWVGRKTEEKLKMYGIHTIGDLAHRTVGSLTRLVGRKFAEQLHENANGRDDSPVEIEVPEAKSISAERTFSNDIGTEKEIDRALFNVACVVAHRMRRADFYTSCVSVFIKYRDFSVVQKQHQISQPTDITAVILNEARAMLRDI